MIATPPIFTGSGFDTARETRLYVQTSLPTLIKVLGGDPFERQSFIDKREDELAQDDPEYQRRQQYRTDVYWTKMRSEDKKSLILTFSHGCSCSRDCCRCCYAHTVEITPAGRGRYVVEHVAHFNV